MKALAALFVIALCALAAGCQQTASPPPPGFTFNRGERFLAAGSPKSAIPFLTQTVASTPDGPEPVALLSLAYALDLQPDRAILQARLVKRPPGSERGWEFVAVGIAKMTQHLPDDAVFLLRPVAAENPSFNPVALSARQWLALAQILGNDRDGAQLTLVDLSHVDSMKSSALLWTTLLHEERGRRDLAATALSQAANAACTESGRMALASGGSNLDNADLQTQYDAAIAALAKGDLTRATDLFTRVRDRDADSGDTTIWMALISGVQENWQSCRNNLLAACEKGPEESRGLASQLFSVVCAMEDRPDAMVQYTLLGQRLMARNGGVSSSYIQEPAKDDPVWPVPRER